MTRQRKASESPLQILTREHNFAQGRLRGLWANSTTLDEDLRNRLHEVVFTQIDRNQYLYEAAVMALKMGDPGGAAQSLPKLQDAIYAAERNKERNKRHADAIR